MPYTVHLIKLWWSRAKTLEQPTKIHRTGHRRSRYVILFVDTSGAIGKETRGAVALSPKQGGIRHGELRGHPLVGGSRDTVGLGI